MINVPPCPLECVQNLPERVGHDAERVSRLDLVPELLGRAEEPRRTATLYFVGTQTRGLGPYSKFQDISTLGTGDETVEPLRAIIQCGCVALWLDARRPFAGSHTRAEIQVVAV
jgi:hypothetical protein